MRGPGVWVPVVEGSDRTGVLALTVPEASDDVVETCEELGVLTGYLIVALSRTTDIYNLYRRRRSCRSRPVCSGTSYLRSS